MAHRAHRVVVITGASAGIGAALAERLGASDGTALVLVARRARELADVAARSGGRVHTIVADMTRRDDVRRVVREAILQAGHVDVWVNNVGRGISRQPSELDDDDIDEMMRVNVKTALYGMQEILPHFKERGQGQIINISSMLGRVPYFVPRSAYTAAKHFLNALTANFRSEVQATHPDIKVTIVSPGIVRTEFGLNARHAGVDSRQMPGSQSAEDVAAVIAGAIESPREDVYTVEGARERVAAYYAALGENP
jgi:NADP-dependent 3-hydroxy acid dehydrogenase YdfG